MLVLSIHEGFGFTITCPDGREIRIDLLNCRPGYEDQSKRRVRFGVTAPRDFGIERDDAKVKGIRT